MHTKNGFRTSCDKSFVKRLCFSGFLQCIPFSSFCRAICKNTELDNKTVAEAREKDGIEKLVQMQFLVVVIHAEYASMRRFNEVAKHENILLSFLFCSFSH